jgi:ribosomal protein S30
MANHLSGCKCKDERYGTPFVQPMNRNNLSERLWCRLECAVNVKYVALGQYGQLFPKNKKGWSV